MAECMRNLVSCRLQGIRKLWIHLSGTHERISVASWPSRRQSIMKMRCVWVGGSGGWLVLTPQRGLSTWLPKCSVQLAACRLQRDYQKKWEDRDYKMKRAVTNAARIYKSIGWGMRGKGYEYFLCSRPLIEKFCRLRRIASSFHRRVKRMH